MNYYGSIALLIVAIVTITARASSLSNCCIPNSEYLALYDFYDGFRGQNWTWTSSGNHWNFTNLDANLNCPCTDEWQGLNCTISATDCHVQNINLPYFNLNGSLADSIGNLTYLTTLILNNNLISGMIPTSIGRLVLMDSLNFGVNKMTGPIPDELWNLTSMTALNIPTNSFTGSFSPLMGNLVLLKNLYVYNTELNGSIPSSICNMSSLVNIRLSNNKLTGPIPETIGNLHQLEKLQLYTNALTGPIPASIGNLTELSILALEANLLSQSIPDSLCNLTMVTTFQINTNSLTGSIPNCIGRLRSVTDFYVEENSFSQSIPESFFTLTQLVEMNLNNNVFTGTLPANFGMLPNLLSMNIVNSFVTGTVPRSVGNLTALQYFVMYVNLLTGTIPSEVSGMQNMLWFELQGNKLTGTLPTSISQLPLLSLIYMDGNSLSGPITQVFNHTHQPHLTQIQLNNNLLTGPLPYSIFGMPSLACFVASINCFHGSIPESICESTNLNVLALDGASTASSCQQTIFPVQLGLGTYTFGNNHITGTIPKCLFNLSQLEVLHLSGNNIQSRLDDSIVLGENLNTLDISHNVLTGYVPNSFQKRTWTELDLSYNRLSGLLDRSFNYQNVSSFVGLNDNRLSGVIPGSLVNMQNISVLEGNIFSCGQQNKGLPEHDSAYDKYECGSNKFNNIIVVWLVLVVLVVGIMYTYQLAQHFLTTTLETYKDPQLIAVGQYFTSLRSQVCAVTAVIVVMLPVYGALRPFFSTYSSLYAWTVSAAYLSGVTPGVTLLVLWFGFILALLSLRTRRAEEIIVLDKSSDSSYHGNALTPCLFGCCVVLLNLTIVSVVNGAFVYITITYEIADIVIASVFLAMFKLVWTRLVLRAFFRNSVLKLWLNRFYQPKASLLIVNNVIIPILATTVIDTSCFYNAFVPASSININIVYTGCANYDCNGTDCVCERVSPCTIITNYVPPFIYSYQCSSSLISTYVPVFAILLLLETFFIPLRSALILRYSEHVSRVCANTKWGWLFSNVICNDSFRPLTEAQLAAGDLVKIVNCDSIIMVFVNLVTILLTWGVVFPPLAVMSCLALVVRSYHIQMGIGLKWQQTQQHTNKSKIAEECSLLPLYSLQSTLPMLFVACIMCSIVVFDTIGDVSGGQATVGLIVMMVGPLMYWGAWRASRYLARGGAAESREAVRNGRKSEIELKKDVKNDETANVMHSQSQNDAA